MINELFLLVNGKYRVIIGQRQIQSSHWSTENTEFLLVSANTELLLANGKYRVLIGQEKIQSSYWSTANTEFSLANRK